MKRFQFFRYGHEIMEGVFTDHVQAWEALFHVLDIPKKEQHLKRFIEDGYYCQTSEP